MTTHNTGLSGPFQLTFESIDSAVTRISPGTYVLGRTNPSSFVIEYVGRSDSDLNGRLQDWVGKYPSFKALYFSSSQAAYQKECEIFHLFGETRLLNNEIHPAAPESHYSGCPIQGCGFGC